MKTIELIRSDHGVGINKIAENGQTCFVHADNSNSLYQEYLASLEATEPEAE